jgi:hypothetical protein
MPNIIDQYRALGAAVSGAATAMNALGTAAKSLGAVVSTVLPAARTEAAQTGAAVAQVAAGIKDVAGDWQQSQIAMLQKLKQLIIPFEGSDAGSKFSFDAIIDDQISKILSGDVNVSDAIQELRRQFGAVYDTFQSKFFGTQDPATRAFLQELENFVNAGNLNF